MSQVDFFSSPQVIRFGFTMLLLLRSSLMPVPGRLPMRAPRQASLRRRDGIPEKVIVGGSY